MLPHKWLLHSQRSVCVVLGVEKDIKYCCNVLYELKLLENLVLVMMNVRNSLFITYRAVDNHSLREVTLIPNIYS
ncbi:CLUMA_CG007147, isoform A [Clunio marinus]|uniref:CLUMA_CG007147, isoform A n=1 Tax=Clunio marinus TaxID=568069 RepID=A0A1J1I5G5_9DIPT|nr:CLUMA_CG007147, isoform A [Clunio marinus]